MNHYPHHIGDYLKDTAHLDPLEDGIYRRMLDLYYTQEGPLERDLVRLCRRLRLDEKKHGGIVKSLLDEFFDDTEAGWAHYRCDTEIGKYREKSEKARNSVAKRWNNERNTNVLPTNAERNTNQNQNQNHTPISPSGEFERFWAAWPKSDRKQGKGKCYEVWKKKKLDSLAEQIITHVEAMKGSEGWRGGYDPAPMTYLNQGRWDGADLPQASSRPAHHASW